MFKFQAQKIVNANNDGHLKEHLWCQKYLDVSVKSLFFYPVDGGHRSIIYSRLVGVQPDIYREGLHFR